MNGEQVKKSRIESSFIKKNFLRLRFYFVFESIEKEFQLRANEGEEVYW